MAVRVLLVRTQIEIVDNILLLLVPTLRMRNRNCKSILKHSYYTCSDFNVRHNATWAGLDLSSRRWRLFLSTTYLFKYLPWLNKQTVQIISHCWSESTVGGSG